MDKSPVPRCLALPFASRALVFALESRGTTAMRSRFGLRKQPWLKVAGESAAENWTSEHVTA